MVAKDCICDSGLLSNLPRCAGCGCWTSEPNHQRPNKSDLVLVWWIVFDKGYQGIIKICRLFGGWMGMMWFLIACIASILNLKYVLKRKHVAVPLRNWRLVQWLIDWQIGQIFFELLDEDQLAWAWVQYYSVTWFIFGVTCKRENVH